jgi:hypothetical protein
LNTACPSSCDNGADIGPYLMFHSKNQLDTALISEMEKRTSDLTALK